MSSKDGSWTHRIPKDMLEREKDFYQTPYACIFSLLDYLKPLFPREASILDFSSGEGNFKKVLSTYFTNIDEIDLYMKEPYIDFLTYEPQKHYDIVLGNPPYSKKFDFIDKARKVGDVAIVLLTAQSESYKIISETYKDTPEYAGKITCYPKFFMDQELREDGSIRFGGVTNYTYLIWVKGEDFPIKFEVMSDIRKYESDVKKLLAK